MSVVNHAINNFQYIPGARLTVDEYGLNSLSRTYIGPTAMVEEFILGKPKYCVDEVYSGMNLDTYEIEDREGNISAVTLNFKGFAFGLAADPIVTVGSKLMSLTFKNPKNLNGPGGTGQYYSSTVSYKTVSTSAVEYQNVIIPMVYGFPSSSGIFNVSPVGIVPDVRVSSVCTDASGTQQGILFTKSITIATVYFDAN